MAANKLVLNSDKTHLLVMTTPYQHKLHGDYGLTLNTGAEIIEPIYSEKLLGGYITNDFKFNEHLKDNEKSAFKSLTSRVNALAKISKLAPFKTRKIMANGIVMSKLIYLIQWWGGCPDYLLNLLQILHNRGARLVTELGQYTPNRVVHYHSLLLIHKVKLQAMPEYFKSHFKFAGVENF